MPVFTERKKIDDIIRWEMYEGYTREAATVYNRTVSTITSADVMGQPLRTDSSVATAFRFLMSTEESYCNALLLDTIGFNVTGLASGSSFKTKILRRGPAIIDKDQLPANDVAGAAFTIATIMTALKALFPPILPLAELTPTVTQTT